MKPASDTRKPYGGQTRSLVLALDIGTTFSGVSYAILEPGEVPKIHGVTRFPGQEHVAGNSKIPSIMYYDQEGNMKAAGAEADGASVLAQAEDEGWIKAELFKLRLRPKSMTLKMNGMRLSPLPRNKSAVDVFGDFLSYLFRCTHSFIVDTHANGHALWRAVENDIQFVLSHPNGWEGAQQTKMRRAAVLGGLIPDTDEGKARIRFVTEGEASLHACVLNGLAADVLSNPSGHGFIVADAGGGTLDISSYAIRGTAPLVIEEIAPPDCVFAGSVFVSRRARQFFEEKLRDSKYGTPDSLDHIAKRFDETTKRLFRDNKELQFVPFGSPLDKDMNVGIRAGQLKLTGDEVASLFEPSIEAAISSIKAQMQASSSPVKSVWLVGGFAASPWLFTQLQERLKPMGVTVSRPDSQTSKAVADGAIGFYCDHHVSARMSKFMYGVEYLRAYDPNDAEHVDRKHRLFEMPSGPRLLPDAFDCILARNVKVKESTVFSRKYCTEVTNLSTLSVFEVEIWCFRGGDDIPKWINRNHEHFSTLCYVRADLSPLAGSAQPKEGKNGKMYWNIVFSIEIHFGLTEFRARIKWTDNGHVKYGPASIVYNEMGHRAEEEDGDYSPDDDSGYARSSQQRSSTSSRAPSVPSTPAHEPISVHSRSVSRAASVAPSPSPRPRQAELQPSVSRTPSTSRTPTHQRTASNASSHPPESDRRHSGYAPRSPESVRESRRSSVLVDGGRQRERSTGAQTPRAPEVLDRSVNLSARSTDSRTSVRTNATARLGETLTSIWGSSSAAASQQATPSPRGEAASYFDSAPREVDELEYLTPAPANSSTQTASKHATPPAASKSATPAVASRSLTPPTASKAATPPTTSKALTPPAASGTATPLASAADQAASATSRVPSKAPTPQAVSKTATPVATPKVSAPAAVSKVPTPAATPKNATPSGSPKLPTPAVIDAAVHTSKAPSKASSRLASKAPTPKAATPKAVSRVPSPKQEPLAPTELAPEAPLGFVADLGTPQVGAKDDPVVPPKPDELPSPSSGVVEGGENQSNPVPGGFDDWGVAKTSDAGLVDLWNADNKPDADAGGFSSFLTNGAQWGSGTGSGATPKRLSAFGALGTGLASTIGSGLSTFGGTSGGWGLGSIGSSFGLGSSQSDNKPAVEEPVVPEANDPLKLDIPPASVEKKLEASVPATPATPSTPATPNPKSSKKKKGKKVTGSYFDQEDSGEAEAVRRAEEEKKAKEEAEIARKAEEEATAKKAEEAAAAAKKAEEHAAAQKAEEEAAAAKKAEEEAAEMAKKAEEAAAAAKAEEEAAAVKKAEADAAARKEEEEAAAAASKKAEEEAEAKKEREAAEEAEKKKAEEEAAAQKTEEEAADAAGTGEAGAAAEADKEGGGNNDTSANAEQPNAEAEAGDQEQSSEDQLQKDLEALLDGDEVKPEDENKDEEDPWFNGKKKKGKKGGSGAASVAAEDMSRTTSAQGGGGGGGGKKKKGKGKK